ncbi:hypothetical protein [Fervidibacillus halotolerans]|uniref:RNA polymerase subunit sigma-70 n=1 Tax=Fervidibacillus halotolerans TaxID=2980027 RepID=A0A9E8LXU8_9BACI|nr:hypothetical protein [Fervidibacillus halotolerans]WAA11556.1 hypothetical protein OE105_07925 [Fervidibacillus halotolerans]
MHSSEKNGMTTRKNDIFGVDFHDFIEKQDDANMLELACEFGLSIGEVRNLKKKYRRL